jgi:hypothetical protein
MKKETAYLYALALIYFIVGLSGMFHHELWLDESHHWLLARDSGSFSELLENTKYEGHPILWNILLYGVTRLTWNPLWMQFLHLLIATSAIIVFLRKAPFPLAFKALFIFGYFMVFEYCQISRNYMIGILFLFIACANFNDREKKFSRICIFLALAANTHLMFALIAFALFMVLLFERWQNKKLSGFSNYIGCFIFIAGFLIAALQIIPPLDSKFLHSAANISPDEKFIKGFISLFKGVVTVPDFRTIHFWNSNLLVNSSKPLAVAIGLILYLVPIILFRKRTTLFFVYVALLGTQIFFFITQLGATRYDGMTYIILILGLWIDTFYGNQNPVLPERFYLPGKPLIYAMLTIHFCSGMYAYAMDGKYAFSGSKNVAVMLEEKHLNQKELVCFGCEGTILSPYLEKKMYYLCEEKKASFCKWQSSCAIDAASVTDMLQNHAASHGNFVFISLHPLPGIKNGDWNNYDAIKIHFVQQTTESIVRNNTFFIYEIVKLP